MSTLSAILIGIIIGLVVGIILGGFVVSKFNPKDITYIIDKLRAKKGGVIEVNQDNKNEPVEKKQKRKLFNFKNRKQ